MKYNFRLILISIIFSGCAAMGTSTLYKTPENIYIHKIGFVDFTTNDTIHVKVYSNAREIFRSTVPSTFKEFGIDSTLYIVDKFDYFQPDTTAIKNVCINNNIDGLVLSTFKYVHLKAASMLIPGAWPTDTKVEMKLFDKNGKLVISTLHDTHMGNSYMMPPSFETSAYDGIRGAAKRLGKEIKSTMTTKKE